MCHSIPAEVRKSESIPFLDANHFASWLNLCPYNKITGGKIISSHTGPGANRATQALRRGDPVAVS